MSIGMSYQEYWYGECELVKYYYRSYLNKLEQININAWLNGVYVYNAFSTVMANAFNKQAKAKYPEKPLEGIFPKTKTDREIDAEIERQRVIEHFTRMKKSWDNHNKE